MPVIRKFIEKIWSYPPPLPDYRNLYDVQPTDRAGKKLILSVGSGRSGMRWMANIFDSHANACGHIERFWAYEPFYRYVTWNQLPIDMSAFYKLIAQSVHQDLADHDISFVSSPFYVFGLPELNQHLKPELFFYHLRRPEDTVNSFYVKGWYQGRMVRDNPALAGGLQPFVASDPLRSFSRIVPQGEQWDWWQSLTRLGKITWFYVQANQAALGFLKDHPASAVWYVKLADIDQNYDYYRHMAESLGLSPVLDKSAFLALKGKLETRDKNPPRSSDQWSKTERKEFDEIIAPFYESYDKIKTTSL